MRDLVSGVSIWIIFTCGILIIWNTCKKQGKTTDNHTYSRNFLELDYEIDVFFEEMKKKFKEKIMRNGKITEMFEEVSDDVYKNRDALIEDYSIKEIPLDENRDLITSVDKLLYSKPSYYTEQEKRAVLDRLDSSEINTRGLFPTKAELKEYVKETDGDSRFKNLEYTDNVEFVKKTQDKIGELEVDPGYGSWKPLDYFDTNMFSLQ
jgi:hypothetical protein